MADETKTTRTVSSTYWPSDWARGYCGLHAVLSYISNEGSTSKESDLVCKCKHTVVEGSTTTNTTTSYRGSEAAEVFLRDHIKKQQVKDRQIALLMLRHYNKEPSKERHVSRCDSCHKLARKPLHTFDGTEFLICDDCVEVWQDLVQWEVWQDLVQGKNVKVKLMTKECNESWFVLLAAHSCCCCCLCQSLPLWW